MSEASPSPLVSVIVPVFNDAARLRLCLDSLEEQTYPSDAYEVIVVDNGSVPPLAMAPGEFAHARLLSEPSPGVSRARLAGLASARGDVLAFTDADCIPSASWLEKGVARLLAVPECGMVGGRIDVAVSLTGRPTAAARLSAAMHLKQDRFVRQGQWAAFANAFVRRRVVERAGGPDPSLVSSGEIEWARRIREAGYGVAYAPEAVVEHPARASVGALCRRTIRFEVAWAQLRERGIGLGWRHWGGQYLVRPALATFEDVLRNPSLTWPQRLPVAALSGLLIALRVVVYLLMRAGWQPDARRYWG